MPRSAYLAAVVIIGVVFAAWRSDLFQPHTIVLKRFIAYAPWWTAWGINNWRAIVVTVVVAWAGARFLIAALAWEEDRLRKLGSMEEEEAHRPLAEAAEKARSSEEAAIRAEKAARLEKVRVAEAEAEAAKMQLVTSLDYIGSSIHDAALSGDIAKLRTFLFGGHDRRCSEDTFVKAINWVRPHAGIYGTGNSTPLIASSMHNRVEATRMLLSCDGILINKPDKDGFTPLHWASFNGYPLIVALLLAAPGVDINMKTTGGQLLDRSPIALASRNKQEEVITLLKAAGAVEDALNRFIPQSKNP